MVDVPTDDEDQGITAYHGSPHEFDQFDLSKIGTGEGAQAYGHGLYFAQSEPVAQEYRDRLSDRTSSFQIENFDIPKWIINKISQNPDQSAAINDLRRDFAQRLSEAEEEKKTSHQPWLLSGRISSAKDILAGLDKIEKGAKLPSTKGHMYEVRINAHPDHLLDWDKPATEQHPHILEAIAPLFPDGIPERKQYGETFRGGDLYDLMKARLGGLMFKKLADEAGIPTGGGTDKRLSNYLAHRGVPGIKYLDQGSRGAGEGSRNYVVFDDKLVTTKRRYERGGEVYGNMDMHLGRGMHNPLIAAQGTP
jgi:hypothetical protein